MEALVTEVYLVRHAHADSGSGPDASRRLSEQGHREVRAVTHVLEVEGVDVVYSSPYTRAMQTVTEFATRRGMPIYTDPGFREREFVGPHMVVEDPLGVMERGFRDPDFVLPGGESNRDVEERGIAAITRILERHPGQRVAIGTHGGVMTLIMGYYDRSFDARFLRRLPRPAIYKLTFQDGRYVNAQKMASFGADTPAEQGDRG